MKTAIKNKNVSIHQVKNYSKNKNTSFIKNIIFCIGCHDIVDVFVS